LAFLAGLFFTLFFTAVAFFAGDFLALFFCAVDLVAGDFLAWENDTGKVRREGEQEIIESKREEGRDTNGRRPCLCQQFVNLGQFVLVSRVHNMPGVL